MHLVGCFIRCSALASWMAFATSPVLAYDWLQFNGDAGHGGNNPREKKITRNNVASLNQIFQATLPAATDGAPVVLRNVQTAGGVQDLLFVTTTAGHILALDARTGALAWGTQFAGSNFTTSSPAIDPDRQFVYTYGLDGYVHKLRVGDGAEITTGGWPQLASLKVAVEKGSSALSLARAANGETYLYVAHGGYPGDAGDYQGHVTAIRLSDGTQKVFNTMCSNHAVHFAVNDINCPSSRQSAVWARPGVIYDAGTNRLFFASGNSSFGGFNGSQGGFNWSESLLAVTPDGAGALGAPIDSYTPTNWLALDNADTDVGSTTVAILPVPATSSVQHLGVLSGKDAKLRLLDLADLNGHGGPGFVGGEVAFPTNLAQSSAVLSQPAVWVNPADDSTWFFIAYNGGIAGSRIVYDGSGNPSIAPQWAKGGADAGTSPVIANNLLYYIGRSGTGGVVRALDPPTGSTLWTSTTFGGVHWQSAVVANGIVYAADASGHLTAYAPTSVPADMDLDGGGRTGLVWNNATTKATAVWLMNGTSIASGGLVPALHGLIVVDMADFDGDGRMDLLLTDGAGGYYVALMNGRNVTAFATLITRAAGGWRLAATGDFNGDGKADIVWHNEASGDTAVWLMNGVSIAQSATLLTSRDWNVTHTGDFNGDGRSDLVWRNGVTGETAVWLMNGASLLSGASSTSVFTDRNWRVTHVGDFDGDGRSDLLWHNGATGATAILLMHDVPLGPGTTILGDADWRVTSVGDFDGDGRSDLVLRNAASGQTAVWLMAGTGGGEVARNTPTTPPSRSPPPPPPPPPPPRQPDVRPALVRHPRGRLRRRRPERSRLEGRDHRRHRPVAHEWNCRHGRQHAVERPDRMEHRQPALIALAAAWNSRAGALSKPHRHRRKGAPCVPAPALPDTPFTSWPSRCRSACGSSRWCATSSCWQAAIRTCGSPSATSPWLAVSSAQSLRRSSARSTCSPCRRDRRATSASCT
jgi:hypothetical protein